MDPPPSRMGVVGAADEHVERAATQYDDSIGAAACTDDLDATAAH
jgi:hypothetical protein